MRLKKWDYLRFFLMFSVVFGHLVDQYLSESSTMRAIALLIYSYHMPLFILISGLFAKSMIKERKWEKLFSLLALYLFTKFVIVGSNALIRGTADFRLFTEGGLPWFAFALFGFSLLTMALQRISPKYVLIGSVLLAMYVGYDESIGDFLVLARIINYFPFFYLGYVLDVKRLAQVLDRVWIKIASGAGLLALAAFVFVNVESIKMFRPLLTGRHAYAQLGDLSQWGFAIRFVYYIYVLLIIVALISLSPKSLPPMLAPIGRYMSWIGQRTLEIYTFHWPMQVVFFEVLNGDALMHKLLPAQPYLLLIPVALISMTICASKPFELVMRVAVRPRFAAVQPISKPLVVPEKEHLQGTRP